MQIISEEEPTKLAEDVVEKTSKCNTEDIGTSNSAATPGKETKQVNSVLIDTHVIIINFEIR
jgi:hypothetical protein